MSEVPVQDTPAVDPAAVEPTTVASEATSDPIRPTGTDALTAESRPEVTEPTTEAETAPVAGLPADIDPAEAPPTSEGILGYKGPGLLKSFRFSKKFFWFGTDAIEPKSLGTYLKNEKADIAHPTAAHASQTGKGLLLYAKRSEDKAEPAGILNLALATDVTEEDLTDFSFKIHHSKHTFQTTTKPERDGWLLALKSAIDEAKAAHEGITSSEGYKSQLAKYAPAAAAAPVAAAAAAVRSHSKKATETKVHDGTEDSAAATTATAEATPKVDAKSRSQSRKRDSIFGKVLGKKDELKEKKEVKKEEKAETKAEEKEEPKAAETAVAGAGTLDASAIAARVLEAPVVPAESATTETVAPTEAAATTETAPTTEAAVVTPKAEAPKPTKRGSVFGSIFGKKDTVSPKEEKKEKDVVPAVPAKDTEVAAVAPQLDPVSTEVPSEETPAVVPEPATETAPAPSAASPVESTPATKEKRRQSFFSLGGKKEKKSESADTEASGSKAGLGGLFRKASRGAKSALPVKDEAAPPVPVEKDVPKSETTEATEAVQEPTVNGVDTAAESEPAIPEPSAAAHSTPIEASA